MNHNSESSIFELYDLTDQLPSLPSVLLQIIEICSNPESTFHELNTVVSKDPGMTARILTIINTPAYGMPFRVDNLERALLLTGMDVIKNIAVSASVYQVFGEDPRLGSRLVLDFWNHSMLTAIYALRLAHKLGFPNPDLAFLSGMLHDIGKLVLVTLSHDYLQIWKAGIEQPDLTLILEQQAGLMHTEAGEYLIRSWNLESIMAEAVAGHHRVMNALKTAPLLHRIVFAANELARDRARIIPLLPEILSITPDDLQDLCRGGMEEAANSAESLGIPFRMDDGSPESETITPHYAELKKEVRNYALLIGSMQAFLGAGTRSELHKTLEEGLSVLFHLKCFVVFEYDSDLDSLMSWSQGFGSALPDTYHIPVSDESTLPARALSSGKFITPFQSRSHQLPSASDRILLQSLGVNGLLAIPVIHRGTRLGVLVIGLSISRYPAVMKKQKLLQLYVRQFASCLNTLIKSDRRWQERMQSRAQSNRDLASRISHEINNPLSVIKTWLKNLSDDIDGENNGFDVAQSELNRVGRLVKSLRTLSEIDPQQYIEKIAINAVLREMGTLFPEEIRYDLDEKMPELTANPDSFRQVFMNLIRNGCEALEGRGILSVRTRFLSPGSDQDRQYRVGQVRGYAEIRVTNTVPVIPADKIETIFEPFHSDKGGEHQGLGLSVVHNLVSGMKGVVRCESSVEAGTAFIVTLPMTERY